MSQKTELQSNNADLQTILSKVNGLPSGSALGDATAADVVQGKTFSSASGINVVGTLGVTAYFHNNATYSLSDGKIVVSGLNAKKVQSLYLLVGAQVKFPSQGTSGNFRMRYDGNAGQLSTAVVNGSTRTFNAYGSISVEVQNGNIVIGVISTSGEVGTVSSFTGGVFEGLIVC